LKSKIISSVDDRIGLIFYNVVSTCNDARKMNPIHYISRESIWYILLKLLAQIVLRML